MEESKSGRTACEFNKNFISKRPDELVSLGQDYIHIARKGDEAVEGKPFDSRLEKSVIEPDYSSDLEDSDTSSHIPKDQLRTGSLGFLKGCYVPMAIENDLNYQEMVAKRWETALADMNEYEKGYEWELAKIDFSGIPLKHLIDNYFRYDKIKHDADCPTPYHSPFLPEVLGEKYSNTVNCWEPEVCPPFPQTWNRWHEEIDIEKLRKMPLKTFFQADVTFVPKNPGAFEPKITKNILKYSTYLISPNKVVITVFSEGREYTFCDRFTPQFLYIITQSVDPRIEEETDP